MPGRQVVHSDHRRSMKKVLIIAYYFPPIAASGAMRPLAFCRFLVEHGWAPRVLTTDPASVHPPHPVDPQLSTRLPPEVQVDRVPHGNILRRLICMRDRIREALGLRRKSPVSAPSPDAVGTSGARDQTGGAERLGGLKELILDWGFAFPDPQCAWFQPAVTVAKRWSRAEIPDVVWATGGPWTSLLVGKHLADYWRVPFVVDYRDPWTGNPYVSFNSPYLNARARRLERAVCGAARRVITNTRELEAQLTHDYPNVAGKTVVITNGYDPDAFPQAGGADHSIDRPVERANQPGELELCHFGTVYGKRTPAVLLQAFAELYQEGRLAPSQIRLRFVGAWEVEDLACEQLAKDLENAGLLKREPPVPYRACVHQMTEADALLVIQPDSPLQIPGKIYEYIATNRPLVLIGGEGATANLVHRHRLGVACANDRIKIRQLVLDLLEGKVSLQAPARDEVARFNYRRLAGEVAAVLDQVCRVSTRPSSAGANQVAG